MSPERDQDRRLILAFLRGWVQSWFTSLGPGYHVEDDESGFDAVNRISYDQRVQPLVIAMWAFLDWLRIMFLIALALLSIGLCILPFYFL